MERRRSNGSAEHGERRPIRVLLAEEIEMFRAALVNVLSEEADIEVVADMKCDPDLMVAAVSRVQPDVVVVATDEGNAAGMATIRALRADGADSRIIALTVRWPLELVDGLMAAGVSGLIGKNAQPARLLQAIRVVAGGGTVLEEGLRAARSAVRANPFTRRERDVLRVVANGVSGPEVAKVLSLSPGTVRNYLSNVMNKTGARNRVDAIRIAKEAGWL
jgi:two-component system response regulator DesR